MGLGLRRRFRSFCGLHGSGISLVGGSGSGYKVSLSGLWQSSGF